MTLEQAKQYSLNGESPRKTASFDEDQMRALADAMPQIVWSARPDGYLDYFNDRWYEFTGFPRGQRGEESWTPILHPDDLKPCLEAWYRAVRSGEPYEMEYRFCDYRTGGYRWHLGRALPMKSAGKVTRWFGTCTDIHDHKEAQQALEEQTRMLYEAARHKDEFLAVLAHELRTPLASVVSAVELLRTEDPVERAWAGDVIERQAGQLTRLIDDLLDVARINSGKIRLNLEPLDLATILDRAVETTRPTIREKQHEFMVGYPQREIFLNGDPARLEQIVVNLLNNAAKYTPAGGCISLRASQSEGRVSIVVKDNGMGIAEEKLPEVFHLFAQGERSGSHSKDGLGLGLTIVQKLVALHGGSVSASSAGPGLGSTFTVQLPTITAPATVAPPRRAPELPASSRARILVVDDHIDSAEGLARLLRRRQHQVELACDGISALVVANRFLPEVFLLDLDLPEMDGCQIAGRLRQESSHRQSLLIALTGYGHEEDLKRCREAGFDHHMLKPVDLDTLQRLLAEHLAKREPNAAN